MQNSYPNSFALNKGKTTVITLSIFLIFLVSFGLEEIGIKIPIVRELFGFISLIFIPGALIVAILKLNNINKAESLLYAIGISLFFIMALGVFVNTVYPLVGIENPISEKPLIATFSGAIVLLIILFNFLVKDFHCFLDTEKFLSPITHFLLLIPLLSILGAYLVNVYSNNILLLILIPLLALFPLFILHHKFPKKFYPLAVFVIGISLMYHITLIGSYAIGDIHIEFHLANIVKSNSYWDYSSLTHPKSNLLSLMIIIPSFSETLGMSFNWIYKIILPFFSSLVPLGIYLIAKKQTNSRVAFLSAFFVMSIHLFFMSLLTMRFRVSELFMMLIILSMISNIPRNKAAPLSILFVVSLVWSYYGVAYTFLMILVIAVPILLVTRRNLELSFRVSEKFSFTFILLYLGLLFSWYVYTANSATFGVLVRLGQDAVNSLSEIFAPVDQGPIDYATRSIPSLYWRIYRWLNFVTQFFIAVGGLWMLGRFWRKSRSKFKLQNTYILFSIVSFFIILIWIIHTPSFSGGGNFGFTRLYSLLLIFLAPLCITGGLKIIQYGARFARIGSGQINMSNKNLLYPLAIFFTIFLLFSSNFIMEVGDGWSTNLGLSQERIMREGSIPQKLSIDKMIPTKQDIYAGNWLSRQAQSPTEVYSDARGCWLFETYIHPENLDYKRILPPREIVHLQTFGEGGQIYLANPEKDVSNLAEIGRAEYIFLRKFHKEQGIMGERELWWEMSDLYSFMEAKNRIYTNGGSAIYK